MEDVLEVYTRPYDRRFPVVCFDELSKTLHAHSREPIPATSDHPLQEDYEYVRCGTANLFLSYEPLASRRHVAVTDCRTRTDWADAIKDLVDVRYPEAVRIILVLDNLNIHSPTSLYQAFPAAEARRLTEKLEIHYTPKHGSWLNMAEIEFSILSRQCLDRRIPSTRALTEQVAAWEAARNREATGVNWRFTTADARIKLKRLYPTH